MLGFLFRSLTAEPARGAELFAAVTAAARQPHWYVAGRVPDTLDGRFAVLATVTALVLVRLERDGDEGNAVAVALTERLIDAMDAEHRELGVGDPTLGKTVRKLVGSLAGRTELWRTAIEGAADRTDATRRSLYKADVPSDGLKHCATALNALWATLDRTAVEALAEGRLQ